MARAGAGGPTVNRRFLMLALVSAALSAVLVYVAISRAGGGGGGDGGESAVTTASVVVAAVEIPARTPITEEMVELRDVPLSVMSTTALSGVEDAVGKVTRYPIPIGEQVTSAKVVSLDAPIGTDALAFVVPKGKRAISIKADQVLSAGGLVLPGDYVDIIGVFDVEKEGGGGKEDDYFVRTILQNVEVLAVAQTIADVPPAVGEEETEETADVGTDGQRARGSEAEPNPEATTLTLLVDPEQAEWVFLAEANGTLRAIVRGFGDSDVIDVRSIVETELQPPDMVLPTGSAEGVPPQ
jgi:pilus assembly protein CpaB